MNRPNWVDFVTPELSHVGSEEAAIDCDISMRRRSVLPDPLTVLIAAESGRPILMPIFGLNGFTPHSDCPHYGPIPNGSPHYCPVCHATGLEDHPMLQLEPGDVPQDDEAITAAVATVADPQIRESLAGKMTTRKERRRQQFQRGPSPDV